MKIKTEAGFLTKAGWEEAKRMGKFSLTEEQRMIGILLNEIKRRDILLEEGNKDPLIIRFHKNILNPTE